MKSEIIEVISENIFMLSDLLMFHSEKASGFFFLDTEGILCRLTSEVV